MPNERERYDKVIAIAVNPGAYEGEAIAALRKAGQLVKQDPSLAHPPPPPAAPPPKPSPPGEASYECRITKIPPFWLNIFLNKLSEEAYGLGLKSKLVCDFSEMPTAVDVRCDGLKPTCDEFGAHVTWLIGYINSQAPK